jgi:hypothetical protein
VVRGQALQQRERTPVQEEAPERELEVVRALQQRERTPVRAWAPVVVQARERTPERAWGPVVARARALQQRERIPERAWGPAVEQARALQQRVPEGIALERGTAWAPRVPELERGMAKALRETEVWVLHPDARRARQGCR